MVRTEDVLKVLVEKYGEENRQLFVDYIMHRITQIELNHSLISRLLKPERSLQKA